jgi:hypothetical protein
VVAEEAVERKEARRANEYTASRAKPWLSELDVPEWQELAGEEEDVEAHQDTDVARVLGT